jgi:hypothetical protein
MINGCCIIVCLTIEQLALIYLAFILFFVFFFVVDIVACRVLLVDL